MRANAAALKRFHSDTRGNQHVVEVMVVGIMVAGAAITFATMEAHDSRRPKEDIVGHQSEVMAFLDTYSAMPSDNITIRFGHRLEEWSIQAINGENQDLRDRIQAEWLGSGARFWFQHNNQMTTVIGPERPPAGPTHVYGRMYEAEWGATIVRPGMSHYGSTQAVDLHLLPIDAGGTLTQYGIPYEVTVRLTDDDGRAYTQNAYGHVRTQGDDPLAPVNVTFEGPLGGRVHSNSVTDLLPRGGIPPTDHVWQLRVNLTSDQSSENEVWWKDGHILRVEPPPGWDYDEVTPAADWVHIPPAHGIADAVHRFQYQGATLRGPDAGHTVTINLTQPITSDTGQVQVASVWTEGARTSNHHLALTPISVMREAPFGVYTSRSEPWTHTDWAPFRVHVTNPRSSDHTLQEVQVVFTNRSHQFKEIDNQALADAGWTMTYRDGDQVAFTWTGTQTLGSGKVHVLDFPGKTWKPEGMPYHRFEAPAVNIFDGGGDALYSVIGHPMGRPGQYTVLTPPMLLLDQYDVTVHDREDGSPPGQGEYQVKLDTAGLLEEVQTARHTMNLQSWPRVHNAHETVQLALETGTLLETLRNMDAVAPGSVRINVTATDLLGYFTNDYHAQEEFSLALDVESQIMGMHFTDTDGAGPLDLLVTYADGHVIALHGDNLPDDRDWREDAGGRVTSPPVMLDVDGEAGDELLVPVTNNGQDWLVAFDTSGAQVATVPTDGYISHLAKSECRPGVWFMESDTDRVNVESSPGHAGFMSEMPTQTNLAYWEPGMTTPERGAKHAGANPFDVIEASFGPFGHCGVLVSLGRNIDTDPRLELSHVDAHDIADEVWRFAGDGLIRGVWARDVATTPLEEPDGATRFDEIVLVTDEHGMEVMTGWVGYQRAVTKTLPGMQIGDRLLGLSWVDHDVGYVVSEMGYVWKTEDAGGAWVRFEEPVIGGLNSITSFVFGGNGEGLLVRDDGLMASFGQNGVGEFLLPDIGALQYRGLAFTSNEPGLIAYNNNQETTAIYQVDNTLGLATGVPLNAIACDCTILTGDDEGLVGSSGGIVHVATSRASRQVPIDVDAVAVQLDGAVLAHDGEAFLFNATNDEKQWVDVDAEATVSSGASRATASLLQGPSHYRLHGNALVKQSFADVTLTNVSTGAGAPWLLTDTTLIRPSGAASYWYRLDAGGDVVPGHDVTVRNDGEGGETSGEYTLHLPNGERFDVLVGRIQEITWEDGVLLEYHPRLPGSPPPTGPGLTLHVEGAFGERALSASQDPECEVCLIPVGREEDVRHASGVWADAGGVLPNVKLPDIGPAPVLGDRVGAQPLVASGSLAGGFQSYMADTGITFDEIQELGSGALSGVEAISLGVVDVPGGDDVFWAETGADPVGINNAAGVLLGQPLTARVSPTLMRFDPGTGSLSCSAAWPDTDRVGRRVLVSHPEDGADLFSGTGMGRLGALISGSCSKDWEEAVGDTGTRILLNLPPPERDWLGTRIYLVDIIVDITPFGSVKVQLMDHSLRNDSQYPRADVWYYMELAVWDWSNMYG